MESLPISLCMIVKDEEVHLPECLDRVGDHVAEIIVVDTGSNDSTVKIAREAGARVEHFDWVDDFSAARNYSLQFADQPWILVVDADEYLTADSLPELQQIISNDRIAAAQIIQDSIDEQGVSSEILITRLFRNDPGIRYEGAIHESVEYSLLDYIQHTGRRQVESSVRLLHHGYRQDAIARKGRRNIDILRRELEDNPDDLYLLYKEAEEAKIVESRESAARLMARNYTKLQQFPADQLDRYPILPMIVVNHAQALMQDGDYAAALDACQWGLERFPGEPWLSYFKAICLNETGRPATAIAQFQRCKRLSTGVGHYFVDPAITTWQPHYHIASIERQRGNLETALQEAQAALDHEPNDATQELLIQIHIDLKQPQQALQLCMARLQKNEADTWALYNGGRILAALGMKDKARAWLTRVAELDSEHQQARDLLQQME